MHRIFVYGTLKRGDCRHGALAGQKFLGDRRTAPRYRIYNVGTYPGLVDDASSGLSIQGELWEVDDVCLALLDEVEGVAEQQYQRRLIELDPREEVPAEAYFYLPNVAGYPDCGERW